MIPPIAKRYGYIDGSCMFCPTDIRRTYGNKIIRKYQDNKEEYTRLLGEIQYARLEEDIPNNIKELVADQPNLQLYVDEYIEVAYAARPTKNTHILLSPVRHIETFETNEDYMVLDYIIKAGWAIMRVSGLAETSLSISLKSTKPPIPHVHFHMNCDGKIDEESVKALLEKRYFYRVSEI
jgi:diadenosine tetraphosphate (Ap4A) HIT family hydrolase